MIKLKNIFVMSQSTSKLKIAVVIQVYYIMETRRLEYHSSQNLPLIYGSIVRRSRQIRRWRKTETSGYDFLEKQDQDSNLWNGDKVGYGVMGRRNY